MPAPVARIKASDAPITRAKEVQQSTWNEGGADELGSFLQLKCIHQAKLGRPCEELHMGTKVSFREGPPPLMEKEATTAFVVGFQM